MREETKKAIEQAKRYINNDSLHDPSLAAFILRDLPEVQEKELSDLAWAMTRDNYVHKNDVLYL